MSERVERDQEDRDAPDGRPGRTGAEWTSFVVACVVLAVVVVLILQRPQDSGTPAAPEATTSGAVEQVAGGFQVPVRVRNAGGNTAAEVQVTAELTIDGETTDADQVIDFLGADEVEDLVFVFPDDPDDGDLVVRVSGFSVP